MLEIIRLTEWWDSAGKFLKEYFSDGHANLNCGGIGNKNRRKGPHRTRRRLKKQVRYNLV